MAIYHEEDWFTPRIVSLFEPEFNSTYVPLESLLTSLHMKEWHAFIFFRVFLNQGRQSIKMYICFL